MCSDEYSSVNVLYIFSMSLNTFQEIFLRIQRSPCFVAPVFTQMHSCFKRSDVPNLHQCADILIKVWNCAKKHLKCSTGLLWRQMAIQTKIFPIFPSTRCWSNLTSWNTRHYDWMTQRNEPPTNLYPEDKKLNSNLFDRNPFKCL